MVFQKYMITQEARLFSGNITRFWNPQKNDLWKKTKPKKLMLK